MSEIIFRGDAVARAKVMVANFANMGDSDRVIATIPNTQKKISYAASSSENAATGLAELINASQIPEFKEMTATASGSRMTLTARTAGKPFFVTFSTQESALINISIVETTPGVEPTNEVQLVLIGGSPTGGSWTYANDFGSGTETTAAIAFDASSSAVQTAIEGLASVASGDVAVTGDLSGGYYFAWRGSLALTEIAEGTIDTSGLTGATASATVEAVTDGRALSDEVVALSIAPQTDTYSYKLNYGGQTTSLLDQDDGPAEVQAAMEALSSIGSGNIIAWGCVRTSSNFNRMFVFKFTGALAETNVGAITFSDRTSITPTGSPVGVIQAGGESTQDEIQFLNFVGTGAIAGDVYLTLDGETTTGFSMWDSAATIEAVLEALTGVSEVKVNGSAAGLSSTNGFVVRFKGTQADTEVSLMTVDSSEMVEPGSPVVSKVSIGDATKNEVQSVFVIADGGTLTLSDGTDTTSAIAYNASAATVKTRLETDIASITTVTVTGSGTEGDPWIITFTSPANTGFDLLTADEASLTGAGGTVTEVVAHNAGTDEVQTITVDAGVTDGVWFATALDELVGPFSHTEQAAVIQSALLLVYGTGNVAVTGSDGGPWVVTFGGDLAETDIDLIVLDGSGLVAPPGDERISVSHKASSAGPHHANDPANWVGGVVPETGDAIMIEDGSTDILYGLNWLSEFTVSATTEKLSVSSHSFVSGQKVRVSSSGTLPAGLAAATDYYVLFLNDDSLRLSATRGGAAVNITDAGTGIHTIEVSLDKYTRGSRHTGKVGLAKRNVDGEMYYEYRNRGWRFGMLSTGSKKITVGAGEGSGSPREIIHNGTSEIDLVVYKTGGSDEPGVPAFQHTGENSLSLVTVHEADCGFAFDAGSTAEYRKIIQHGGVVNLGKGQTVADLLKTDGDFIADEANFSGTLTIVG